jgi:thioredoxin 1
MNEYDNTLRLPGKKEISNYVSGILSIENTAEAVTIRVSRELDRSILNAHSGEIEAYILGLRTEGKDMHLDLREVQDLGNEVLSTFYSACRKKADEEDTMLTLSGITRTQEKQLRSTLTDSDELIVVDYQDTRRYPQVSNQQTDAKAPTRPLKTTGKTSQMRKPASKSNFLLKYALPAALTGLVGIGVAYSALSRNHHPAEIVQKENSGNTPEKPVQTPPQAPVQYPIPQKPEELPKLEEITRNNLEAIKKGNVIVDVWAPWCGPCKRYEPPFAETAQKYGIERGISFVKMNFDDNKSNLEELVKNGTLPQSINAIPFTFMMKDGKVVASFFGGNVPALEKEIEEHYPKNK